MFSSRTPGRFTPNRLTQAVARRRADGADILDLTASNPTRAGLDYPAGIFESLARAQAVPYEPYPLGLPQARRAVADHLARLALPADAQRIVLTASTSEAYSMLFKLLCDPGEGILVPHPSYPLLEYLTSLDGVEPQPYSLEYHGVWSLDRSSLSRALTGTSRAILLVNPNNPTGSLLRAADLDYLLPICGDRSLALISDEVFGEYRLDAAADSVSSVLMQHDTLGFVLGGLSKTAGLPQLKLSWIALCGPDTLVDAALARLEIICDTYLSVGTPIQHALAEVLEQCRPIQAQITARIRENFDRLGREAARLPEIRVLRAEGGWYAVVQGPATESEETLVLDLLERESVLVHPGYFFDFPKEAFLVLSLLPEPVRFAEGIGRIFSRWSLGSRS